SPVLFRLVLFPRLCRRIGPSGSLHVGEVLSQIIYQSRFLIGSHFGAPSDHLVHFRGPLGAGQSLLADGLAAVAAQAALIDDVFSFIARQRTWHFWWNDRMVREILGQIIYKFVLGFGRNLGAPADHLVDLAQPFVARQPLLNYGLRSVAAQTALGNNI